MTYTTAFYDWLTHKLGKPFTLTPLPGDASFRKYYRISTDQKTFIAVDSPNTTENNQGFLNVSHAFMNLGISVPKIFHHDLTTSFFLIEDFGDKILFSHLNDNNAENYYYQAFEKLNLIQSCKIPLPDFDGHFIQIELNNFKKWFLETHLQYSLSSTEENLLIKAFESLIDSAISQPQCCIHRDYHSKNLMILENDNLGILDFQDAMIGPITYDLISLIRDAYIGWPPEKVRQWALDFYQNFLKCHISSEELFLRYMDFMGIQRHLKASFIFARKFHRDHNENYLKYLPLTLQYIYDVSQHYSALNDFRNFMEEVIL